MRNSYSSLQKYEKGGNTFALDFKRKFENEITLVCRTPGTTYFLQYCTIVVCKQNMQLEYCYQCATQAVS
jgi:hypothetical protein